jgi:2,4-dienoyl-CoA reductase-like NADH-dependent reductase (Old Yellow Enzyme family)
VRPEAGGWTNVLAPSAQRFSDGYPMPIAMTTAQIDEAVAAFGTAAARAHAAGFEVLEIHAAHGYLIHEFLSPLSNERTDEYGGSLENRFRFLKRVVASVRANVPDATPLFVRISATDWVEGGWDLESSVALAAVLKADGVDLLDVSSGALSPMQKIPVGPGYQTSFAAEIRRRTGLATGAVGLITSPEQAEHIVQTGQADLVLLARELLRDPYWPRRAAAALRAKIEAPKQYGRAW